MKIKWNDNQKEIIRARNDAGLFSNIFSVIGALHWCEQHNYNPVVYFDTGPYLDKNIGPNWWDYYFEPVGTIKGYKIEDASLYHYKSMDFAEKYIKKKEICRYIIKKYIKVKQDIIQETNDFWESNIDKKTIGIHIRGSDKWLEAKISPIEKYFKKIDNLINNNKNSRIVLATESNKTIDEMRKKYGNRVVFRNAYRTDGKTPLHRTINEDEWKKLPWGNEEYPVMATFPPYKIGKDAIIDVLLLSMCDVFIGSFFSNLSHFVYHYKPGLTTELI